MLSLKNYFNNNKIIISVAIALLFSIIVSSFIVLYLGKLGDKGPGLGVAILNLCGNIIGGLIGAFVAYIIFTAREHGTRNKQMQALLLEVENNIENIEGIISNIKNLPCNYNSEDVLRSINYDWSFIGTRIWSENNVNYINWLSVEDYKKLNLAYMLIEKFEIDCSMVNDYTTLVAINKALKDLKDRIY